MGHQIVRTVSQFRNLAQSQGYDKVIAAAIGTGIGISQGLDDFGNYISKKRDFRDFTKPRRRKGEILLEDADETKGTYQETYRAVQPFRYGSRSHYKVKTRRCCRCTKRRRRGQRRRYY